jgi:hypothetical protein
MRHLLSVLPTWSHSTDQALNSMRDDVSTHRVSLNGVLLGFTNPDAHQDNAQVSAQALEGSRLLLLEML